MKKTVKKLAIRSLRRGIGSMDYIDYIDTLLIMEDDLDDDSNGENLHNFGESSEIETLQTAQCGVTESQSNVDPNTSSSIWNISRVVQMWQMSANATRN